MIHVIPLEDLKSHTENTICECDPVVEIINNNMLVIHNAFDKRDLIEEAQQRINIKKLFHGWAKFEKENMT